MNLITFALTAVGDLSGVVVAASVATAFLAARKAIRPRPHKRLVVLEATSETLTLPATQATLTPGQFAVWYDTAETGHAVVGTIITRSAHSVTRTIERWRGRPLQAGDEVRWAGNVFAVPGDLGLAFEEVLIDAPSGLRPAWYFPAPSKTTWAIHVHGIHTTRISAVRSVPATHMLGMPSLVVTYGGDPEGPGPHVAGFGQHEWRDVDAAVTYALNHGAECVLLVGWSMGATISLLLASFSNNRKSIAGLVLVSPALDWHAIIGAGLTRSSLPKWLRHLIFGLLSTPGVSSIVGLSRPLNRRLLRPGIALVDEGIPIAIIHSPGDTDSPIAASQDLAFKFPRRVTLDCFPAVPHQMEWNADAERFSSAVEALFVRIPNRTTPSTK